jgi:hypothetical protein
MVTIFFDQIYIKEQVLKQSSLKFGILKIKPKT